MFALANYLITVIFQVQSFQHLFSKLMNFIFMRLSRGYGSGVLFLSLISGMWWCGIHGNNVLNQVADNMFVEIIPGEIVSKSFIDNASARNRFYDGITGDSGSFIRRWWCIFPKKAERFMSWKPTLSKAPSGTLPLSVNGSVKNETEEQRAALEQIGCLLYQGYLFSPAVDRDTLLSMQG